MISTKQLIILILLVFGTDNTIFCQSKKKINHQLIFQHDSLVNVIEKFDLKVDSITLMCSEANQSLLSSINNFKSTESKKSFYDFKRFYERIESANEDFPEESSLYFDELNKRYPLFNELEFNNYCEQVNSLTISTKNHSDLITTRKFNLTKLRPNLALVEKVGNKNEWNELIFSQNQSLKYYIELQDNYLKNQIALAGYAKDEAKENIIFYQEFYLLMEQTKIENENLNSQYLIWIREKERIEAENARLQALYRKKNKIKTIEFIAPIVTDEIDPIYIVSEQRYREENSEAIIERIEPEKEPKAAIKVEKKQEEEIYTIVDEPAEFPGGIASLKTYFKENLLYPESAREIALEGKVYLRFIVSKTGEISNVSVLKGITDCNECNKEALRLIKSMPKWKPSKINGKEVNSYFTIPVTFKID